MPLTCEGGTSINARLREVHAVMMFAVCWRRYICFV